MYSVRQQAYSPLSSCFFRRFLCCQNHLFILLSCFPLECEVGEVNLLNFQQSISQLSCRLRQLQSCPLILCRLFSLLTVLQTTISSYSTSLGTFLSTTLVFLMAINSSQSYLILVQQVTIFISIFLLVYFSSLFYYRWVCFNQNSFLFKYQSLLLQIFSSYLNLSFVSFRDYIQALQSFSMFLGTFSLRLQVAYKFLSTKVYFLLVFLFFGFPLPSLK